MARVAIRMHGPAAVSNVAATKYTVPANRKGILRHVHVQNPTGAAITFTMSIGTDAAGVRIFDAYSIPANTDSATRGVIDHYCYYVLEEAEIIQAFSGGAGNVLTLTIDGDESILS